MPTHARVQVFDRITPKAMRPLQRTQRVFRSVTTSDDPVIRSASCSSCSALVMASLQVPSQGASALGFKLHNSSNP